MTEIFRCQYVNVTKRGSGGDIREFTAHMVRHPNPWNTGDEREYTLHGVLAGDSFVLPDGCCKAEYDAVNLVYGADGYDQSEIVG